MAGDATTAARRPSLTNKGSLDEIVHLLAEREPVYRESAHWAIETEGKSPEAIADEILATLPLPTVPGSPA
jgi:shikimate kinase